MKNENGVTILALVVTITIMAIISFAVFYTAKGINTEIDDDILLAELETVHHIVLQEWNKKLTLGNSYKYIHEETTVTSTNFDNYKASLSGVTFKKTYDKYYELTPSDLESLGAKNVSSKYLVCYETGEVANITEYKTDSGEILYTK